MMRGFRDPNFLTDPQDPAYDDRFDASEAYDEYELFQEDFLMESRALEN